MNKNILENFARASTYNPQQGFLSKKERKYEHEKEIQSGIKNFKRKVLGLCGGSTIKSIDELAIILSEMDIVSDKKDADKFIQKLYKKESGSIDWNYNNFLAFTPVKNEEGEKKCRIEHGTYCDFDYFN